MFTFPLTSVGWSLWAPASQQWTLSPGSQNILHAEQVNSWKCKLFESQSKMPFWLVGRVFTQEELMWKIKLCWSVPGSSSCWNHPTVTTARWSRTKIQIAHWLSNFSRLGIPQTRILPGGLRCCSHQGMYQGTKDSPDWPDVLLIFPLCNTELNVAVNLFIIQIMSSQGPSKELFHWL